MEVLLMSEEPDAIWSSRLIVFDKSVSLTQNVILKQGDYALRTIRSNIEKLYASLSAAPSFIGLSAFKEIPEFVSNICLQLGTASSIMFDDSSKKHRESSANYALRIERFNYAQRHCNEHGAQPNYLFDRKIRNQIVHCDEHIANAFRKNPNKGWFIDIALHDRSNWKTSKDLSIGFIRSFVAKEQLLIHLDNEIFLPSLHSEVNAVLAAVFGVKPTGCPTLPDIVLRS
jgi:hypothetical protein